VRARPIVALTLSLVVLAGTAVLSGLGPLSGVAFAGSPGWITSCPQSAADHVADPIGGATHVHRFVGAREVLDTSTPDTMRASGTSCLTAGDDSGYWIPQPLEDGQPVALGPKGTQFYYRRKAAPSGVAVQSFPDGLKLVVGNAHATSPAENPLLGTDITFKCGPGSNTETATPPAQCGSGVAVVVFILPNCGDGRLDSPDHFSHMAYPIGSRCPADHPIVFPRIQAFWRLQVGTDPIDLTFSSGLYFTAHMDFESAWQPAALQSLVDRCINAGVDCGVNPA
jgi:hypothetical protein